MMDFIKTIFHKNKIVVIFLVLSLFLVPCVVHAADLDEQSSSAVLPYLAPNLDDARLYSIASDIKASTATTYDLDDIYNMLVSIRSYINTSNNNTSTILSRLEDLTGYNTAYDTHSMLVDLWSKLGGNENYSLYNFVRDINGCLEITDGNESYNITELVAGIYGISGTPRSLTDIYNKLGSIDTSINDNFIAIANDTYNINSAIQRLADIYASNDVAQAKLNQQDYENDAIADFTGSGTGAATTANKNDIKGISSTVKSGLNTGGSASNALGVFNYSNSNWSWFTQTTADNLYTPPNATGTYLDTDYTQSTTSPAYINLSNNIPANSRVTLTITASSAQPYNRNTISLANNNSAVYQIGSLSRGATSATFTFTSPNQECNQVYLSYPYSNITYHINIISATETRKTNNIPDFITNHDNQYYDYLLEEHKK